MNSFTVLELQQLSKGVAVCIMFSFLCGTFFMCGAELICGVFKRLRKRNREEAAE